jgi:hypothetical protein
VQIPVSPVPKVSTISTTWRSTLDVPSFYFFKVLHSSVQCGHWESQPRSHLNMCALTCARISILSLLVNYFHFPLLFMFSCCEIKSRLTTFGLYKVMSRGHWKTEKFKLGELLLNVFWNTYQTWERQTALDKLQLH